MSKLFLTLLITALLVLPKVPAFADTVCQPVYGGGQSCVTTGNLQVVKTVQNPRTFAPNDQVSFTISVTNTGGSAIQQVNVKDLFPSSLIFVSGPGVFDPNSNPKTLSFTIDNLNPNQTRDNTVVAKIVDASQLPTGRFCFFNQVTATPNVGQMVSNNAQVCVEKAQVTTKGGLPVFPPPQPTTTPATGPELIPLISLLPGGLAGWFLRRKSNKLQGGKN